jgi:asparagine synthase (glutamine-hydrolysing)
MCGIAGAFAFSPDLGPVDASVIQHLNTLQSCRGPDGHGIWASQNGNVVLGHRRLAIIDIGASGAQPMSDASGRWIITFNGEIYNYRALRSELEREGCKFLTNSDTEVLINVVARWGEAGLRKLRGMFAFALWDSLQQELWFVRDPYGIKPLYFAENAGTIWFASQARSLAKSAPIDTRRSAAALVGFYLWGHVPEPFCWWEGVRMLPAGHLLRISKGKSMPAPFCYARIQDAFVNPSAGTIGSAELRDIVLDSVRHHMVADVPVGIFLSAGIDSNVLAALSAETGARLHTVTLAFNEYANTENDEAPFAEAAAKILGSEHATVRIERDQFEGMLDDFLRSMDQPTIDGLNTYLVSHAAASQGLKVALSGLGGDELFGGYPSFRQIPLLLSLGRWIIHRPKLSGVLNRVAAMLPLLGVPPKAAGLINYSKEVENAYLLRRALYLDNELDALLDESWLRSGLEELQVLPSLAMSLKDLKAVGSTEYAQVAALESCWYMRNQLLRDADWSSMAHGVEVRVPFVDVTLLERLGPVIASGTPPSKYDIAESVGGLPYEIMKRPKTGFTTPVRQWSGQRLSKGRRGLRGWAIDVHRNFRGTPESKLSQFTAA